MKRKWMVLALAIFTSFPLHVNARNLQPLIESIVLLELYLGYLKKGYDIANKGLNTIKEIKNGELKLHTDYYNSLKKVKPSIEHYSKIIATLKTAENLTQLCQKGIQVAQESKEFDAGELAYLKKVYDKLYDAATKDVDELEMVISDDKVEMKDAERIKRIDVIYNSMQDKYSFLSDFNKRLGLLALSRKKEQNDVMLLRKLYNL